MNFVQHQDSSRGEDNDDDTKENTKYVENEKRSQISETETILDRVETKGSNSYDDQATVDLFIGERVAGVEMKDEQNKKAEVINLLASEAGFEVKRLLSSSVYS